MLVGLEVLVAEMNLFFFFFIRLRLMMIQQKIKKIGRRMLKLR